MKDCWAVLGGAVERIYEEMGIYLTFKSKLEQNQLRLFFLIVYWTYHETIDFAKWVLRHNHIVEV